MRTQYGKRVATWPSEKSSNTVGWSPGRKPYSGKATACLEVNIYIQNTNNVILLLNFHLFFLFWQLTTKHASWLPWVVFFFRLCALRIPEVIIMVNLTVETRVSHWRNYIFIEHWAPLILKCQWNWEIRNKQTNKKRHILQLDKVKRN